MNINVKYEKESRFEFRVALVKTNDVSIKGHRIPSFDYTEKTIIREED